MERILISMRSRQGAWEAWSRTISLAKRIHAKVYSLLVLSPSEAENTNMDEPDGSAVRKRLELLVELAEAEGIHIDYFITEGEYEEEVIKFIDHHKITLLIAESVDGDIRRPDQDGISIDKIRHRIACRMEIVSPRKNTNKGENK